MYKKNCKFKSDLDLMNNFINELEVGEIHFRDRWQFELKSEFIPSSGNRCNEYIQEFYLFIPNSLQMNSETYSKEQFYQDQTNFIRYRTPQFTLEKLLDPQEPSSPLTRLARRRHEKPNGNVLFVKDELQLLGNIFRSSLRERVNIILNHAAEARSRDEEGIIKEELEYLCSEVKQVRTQYLKLQTDFLKNWTSINKQSYFVYIDEFMSNTIEYYFTGLRENLNQSAIGNQEQLSQEILDMLVQEKLYRDGVLNEPQMNPDDPKENEYILYRKGLLNKFVMDALLLSTDRQSIRKRFGHIVGSIAAGIAMLIFFVLFVFGGRVFIINSIPFILVTVFLYIIKDRIKDALQTLSFRQFSKWFSDFKTDIYSPEGNITLGKMYESVSFLSLDGLPEEIIKKRDREFHAVLESMKRPEHVLYYKKRIKIFQHEENVYSRRSALSIIFRFNIRKFLEKADDPTQNYTTIDPVNKECVTIPLPKVYHLNVILKETLLDATDASQSEYKKFRIILDKNGITRVEQVRSPAQVL